MHVEVRIALPNWWRWAERHSTFPRTATLNIKHLHQLEIPAHFSPPPSDIITLWIFCSWPTVSIIGCILLLPSYCCYYIYCCIIVYVCLPQVHLTTTLHAPRFPRKRMIYNIVWYYSFIISLVLRQITRQLLFCS